jgi:hypothetical protein
MWENRRQKMKTLTASYIVVAVLICSCASLSPERTSLSKVKSDLVCVPYEKGMRWDTVYGELGRDPDVVAQIEPSANLNKYAMGYRKMTVILNVEKQEVREGKTVRFPEVVTGLELCRKK